jgi:hypothetical protein
MIDHNVIQRDYTDFCKSRMEAMLSEIKSPVGIRLFNVSGLKGHALVTYRFPACLNRPPIPFFFDCVVLVEPL